MSNGFDGHTSKVTFGEVADSTNMDELYEWADQCSSDDVESDRCPSCFAYVRAQAMEYPERNLDFDEPPC